MKVYYRWHPYYGKEIYITRSILRNGEPLCYGVFDPRKQRMGQSIPAWMLDENRCPSGTIQNIPCFSEDSLFALQHVLDEIVSSRQIDKDLLNQPGEYSDGKEEMDSGGAMDDRTGETNLG